MKLRTKTIITGLIATVALCGIVWAQGRVSKDLISILLTPQQQRQCGVHKLSASERASLAGVFHLLLRSSRLGDSAVEYLKDEGWDEVKVLGKRTMRLDEDSDPEEYIIAEKGAWTYILEPKTFSSISPGTYLGKMGFTSCEIIDSDGDTVEFWTEDTR
ncbi:MAG: hypothetical protein JXB26_19880 [Candidatus Aminicenantes bacterium]|nr:hypothetical protein [Candidatus Aminicenantes bacterium]